MEEETNLQFELGTNPDELFTSTETREIDIEYNNKLWKFVIRDLTWSEKNQIISDSAIMKTTDRSGKSTARFDVNKYNQLYLEKSIVSGPIELTKVNFLKLDAKFGDLLVVNIVERSEELEEDEEKN